MPAMSPADTAALCANDSVAPSIPVHLALRGVDYHVQVTMKQQKQILFGVDADFHPGQLTAVMGPSGAGKTTVLNLLTQNAAGKITGEVFANGRGLHTGQKSIMNLVPQEDVLLPALTVRETLAYAAMLRLPGSVSPEERRSRVEGIISALGLTECSDTRVGNVDKRGISGGQRKRVSVGLELLTQPSVLFLDEPTSGLDSKAAEDVCGILKDLARQGHTVICTIHQPSWKLFSLFDNLLMLSQGQVVYSGSPAALPGYFDKLGFPSPPNENPVDHVLRVIQEQEVPTIKGDNQAVPTTLPEIPSVTYSSSMARQVGVLFRRNCYDFVKDPEKCIALGAMKAVVSTLVGLCWWNTAGTDESTKAFTVSGVCFLMTMNCLMDNLFDTVMRFPQAKQLFLREYKNGCFSSFAWVVAYLAQVLLFQILYALLLLLPAYFMVRLRLDGACLPTAVAIIFMLSCVGATAGLLVGALANDLQQAQGAILPVIMPMIIFCGYVIPYSDIPVFFKWVYHIDVFQWGVTMLKLNQFAGWQFKDCPSLGFCTCIAPGDVCTGDDFLRSQDLDPDTHHLGSYFLYTVIFFGVLLVPTFFVIRWKGGQKTG